MLRPSRALCALVLCFGCGGTTATLVGGAPVISAFAASPASITSGQSSTLSWTVAGAVSLSIDNGVGEVTGASSKAVSPTATTTYTLTATNAKGNATSTTTVTVAAGASLPTITSFTAAPASISAGQSSTLSWAVTGATSLSIDNGVGAVTGASKSVTPSATTLYTLTATNAAGNATATALVTVSTSTAAKPWVSAYYAGYLWDWTGSDPAVAIGAVDMTTMTHFIFARYAPGAGTLGGTAGQLMTGAGTGHAQVEDALIAKAHTASVVALMMVGGAGDGDGWIASTAAGTLSTFIGNVLDKAVAKNYDGVDIDWEENQSTPSQQQQIIDLLTQLRSAAAARPRYQSPNKPFVLTFPAFVLNTNTDLPVPSWKVTVTTLVDQYNLMSYGLAYDYPGWQTWLWSPLTGAGGSYPMSIGSTIDAFVTAGAARSKMGLGMGLYGAGYAPPASGPRQTISSMWSESDTVSTYEDLYTSGMLDSASYHFDSAAQAGYYAYSTAKTYRGHSVGMLITEDLGSIAAKGAWAKAGNCGGGIVWTVNYGYVASLGTNPPMNAIKAAFK